MKICIVGAGVVGSYIARKLSQEGYDIAIIDKNKEKIEDIQRTLDVASYNCDAFSEGCIEHLRDYELFVVVTNNDAVNLSIALMLKAVFKKDKILVRIDEEILSKSEIENFLDIEIVNAFNEIIKNIETVIKYPFMEFFNEFEQGRFLVFSYKVSNKDGFVNRSISEFNSIREEIPFTIALIERDGRVYIPSGKKVLLKDDIIYILLEKRHLDNFIEKFKIQNEPAKNIHFLGLSRRGFAILKKLSEQGSFQIKVYEPDINLCEKAAEEFPDITVIRTKLIDEETLKSEGIGEADLVISASYREENILACMLAKRLGAKKVLALLEHPEYEEMARLLGIDIPLIARKIVARRVYRKIRHKGLVDTFELIKNIDISEIPVDRKKAGKKVSEISSGNFVILGIKRDNQMYIAKGNTLLEEGDILIVLEKEEDEEF